MRLSFRPNGQPTSATARSYCRIGSVRTIFSTLKATGRTDLQYFEGDWAYHDSYLGENDFIGEEAVYFRGQVVWAMNYFGRILKSEGITSAEAGQMIKVSLTKMYAEGRFLGGYEHVEGDLTYVDTSDGDHTYFTGREWISRGGQKVYELVYHGGLVN